MALILRYRLEVPDEINQKVHKALTEQVGKVGLNVQVPLDDDGRVQVLIEGQFTSIEEEM